MGCISSKAMGIREELRSSAVSVSVWEEFLTSSHGHSGNDQLLAFVCSAKLKSRPTQAAAEVETAPDVAVKFTRSRSCHTAAAEEENRWDDLDDKRVGGSRSFHTVEEYDALLERIRLQDYDENVDSNDELELEVERERGWKRKAVARGLKSLDMELPSIERIKQIYSPGTYVTPKFGTYNNYNANANALPSLQTEGTPFSPELVAAFEDSMQQLQLEEDCFLRHMDEEEEDHMKHHVT